MKILIAAIIVIVLQQHIELVYGGKNKKVVIHFVLFDSFLVPCANNPCNLVTGTFDASTGYCCIDISATDSVCTCPNNIQPVVNGPCRKKSKIDNK